MPTMCLKFGIAGMLMPIHRSLLNIIYIHIYIMKDNLGSNSSVIQDNLSVERDNVQIKIIIKNI